ncbi:hypothetical protein AMAG_01275 [Allomyces macrogynus ATCC 38327]|uniref:mRNA decay factor PAT1 domain-containing protein n=1 Tax=Allomyces macrogynus (strain ATCC 38327) TaxID=578462 RepID=A0A0L0RYE6_ALLM3|nr:hypothetical protein AMAG_01275 [Allomyces macrogynus ATCC 38327]|eukprot:KNE55378.1 hypothetical protein AMAG_01275 [Allomyces macrogynus ATCC 38327]
MASSFFGFDSRLPRDRAPSLTATTAAPGRIASPNHSAPGTAPWAGAADPRNVISFHELEGLPAAPVEDDRLAHHDMPFGLPLHRTAPGNLSGGAPRTPRREDAPAMAPWGTPTRPPAFPGQQEHILADSMGQVSLEQDAFSKALGRLEAARRASQSHLPHYPPSPLASASPAPTTSSPAAQQPGAPQFVPGRTPPPGMGPGPYPGGAMSLAELEAQLMQQRQHQQQQPPPGAARSSPLPHTSAPPMMGAPAISPDGQLLPGLAGPDGSPFPMGMPPHMMGMMPPGMGMGMMMPPPHFPGAPHFAVPPPHMARDMPPHFAGMPPGMGPPPMMFPPPDVHPSMSLDEVERVMLEQQVQARMQQQMAMKRARRDARMRELSKYNGIMTQYEKDQIARIQISQLVTADPMKEDFYYQVYSSLRGNPTTEASAKRAPPLLQRGGRGGGSLQDQIQRIVQNAKKRPKATQISLEGALGTISRKTVKNPRQILQVSAGTANPTSATSTNLRVVPTAPSSKAHRKAALKAAEALYQLVIDIENLNRNQPTAESKRSLVMTEDGDERAMTLAEELESWERELTTAMDTLWGRLRQPDGDVDPVVLVLSCSKGKKLWPRLVRLLAPHHATMLALALFSHAQLLDVVQHSSLPALYAAPQLFPGLASSRPSIDALLEFMDATEQFMHHVVPPLVHFIADAPWNVVQSCLEVLLDRNDVVRLGASRAGLVVLTMLVSRAEILHQTQLADAWPDMFQRLFAELQGHYLAFFPLTNVPNLADELARHAVPAALLLQLQQATAASTRAGTPTPAPEALAKDPAAAAAVIDLYLTDDVHVWQFLAAMAVAAGVDQQYALVAEVRDRIVGNVAAGQAAAAAAAAAVPGDVASATLVEKAERSLHNVNLFLHALGLDASQIQA